MTMSKRARSDTKNGNTQKIIKTGVKTGIGFALPLVGAGMLISKAVKYKKNKDK